LRAGSSSHDLARPSDPARTLRGREAGPQRGYFFGELPTAFLISSRSGSGGAVGAGSGAVAAAAVPMVLGAAAPSADGALDGAGAAVAAAAVVVVTVGAAADDAVETTGAGGAADAEPELETFSRALASATAGAADDGGTLAAAALDIVGLFAGADHRRVTGKGARGKSSTLAVAMTGFETVGACPAAFGLPAESGTGALAARTLAALVRGAGSSILVPSKMPAPTRTPERAIPQTMSRYRGGPPLEREPSPVGEGIGATNGTTEMREGIGVLIPAGGCECAGGRGRSGRSLHDRSGAACRSPAVSYSCSAVAVSCTGASG
jgi:hypothetical protein